MPKKFLIIGLMVLLFVFLMVSFSITPVKPLTGTKQADLGRKHATSLASPSGDLATSGDHYEDWTKAGVYDSPKDDGNLIHSMEHGYVILSYNCERKFSIFNFQLKHMLTKKMKLLKDPKVLVLPIYRMTAIH